MNLLSLSVVVEALPQWYLALWFTLLGLIVGSFLNVVIYRFHTGKSLGGSSHCLSCGEGLRWFELLPVVSYLVLRGRCRHCQSFIPARYLVVELTTALGFALIFLHTGLSLRLPLELILFCILLVMTVYDYYHLIIPNELVVAVGGLALGLWWLQSGGALAALWPALASGTAVWTVFAGMWYVSGGRWLGYGDAKLSLPLGFLLGPVGTFTFFVSAFWIGAVVSVGVLAVQWLRKRGQVVLAKRPQPITIKSEVPFAPFMVAAFLVTYYTDWNVLEFFSLFTL